MCVYLLSHTHNLTLSFFLTHTIFLSLFHFLSLAQAICIYPPTQPLTQSRFPSQPHVDTLFLSLTFSLSYTQAVWIYYHNVIKSPHRGKEKKNWKDTWLVLLSSWCYGRFHAKFEGNPDLFFSSFSPLLCCVATIRHNYWATWLLTTY